MPQIVPIDNKQQQQQDFTMAQQDRTIEQYIELADRNTLGYYQRPQLEEVVGDPQMDPRTRHSRYHSFVSATREALQENLMCTWDLDRPDEDQLENPLEWHLHPEYDEETEEETGRFMLTTVVKRGNLYCVEEKAIAFGNCYQCFGAGPLGIRCLDCGNKFRKIYFVTQPGMWRGRDFQERLQRADRQPVLPFRLGADIGHKAPYINIDARVYDQGTDYIHDPNDRDAISIGDLYHIIDMWNGHNLDAQVISDLEREIRLIAQVDMTKVEWSIDQFPRFSEPIRQGIDHYRRLRSEIVHPFIEHGIIRFPPRRIGPAQQEAAPQQQVRQPITEESDQENIAQEPVPPPANDNDSDEYWG